MHRVRHPLLEQAQRLAAELRWERAACEVCSSRGTLGSARDRSHRDEPEPCPACLGVSFVWLDEERRVFHVEDLVEHARRSHEPERPDLPTEDP